MRTAHFTGSVTSIKIITPHNPHLLPFSNTFDFVLTVGHYNFDFLVSPFVQRALINRSLKILAHLCVVFVSFE